MGGRATQIPEKQMFNGYAKRWCHERVTETCHQRVSPNHVTRKRVRVSPRELFKKSSSVVRRGGAMSVSRQDVTKTCHQNVCLREISKHKCTRSAKGRANGVPMTCQQRVFPKRVTKTRVPKTCAKETYSKKVHTH